jgi:hypothetical protein
MAIFCQSVLGTSLLFFFTHACGPLHVFLSFLSPYPPLLVKAAEQWEQANRGRRDVRDGHGRRAAEQYGVRGGGRRRTDGRAGRRPPRATSRRDGREGRAACGRAARSRRGGGGRADGWRRWPGVAASGISMAPAGRRRAGGVWRRQRPAGGARVRGRRGGKRAARARGGGRPRAVARSSRVEIVAFIYSAGLCQHVIDHRNLDLFSYYSRQPG